MDTTNPNPTAEMIKKSEEMVAGIFAAAQEGSQEDRKARVERAAAVMQALETEGGKLILMQIEQQKNLTMYPPETYLMELSTGQQVVNETLVGRAIGMREALTMLSNWFASCRKVVEEEVKRSNAGQNSV